MVRRRRMVRSYDPDRPVPPAILQRVLDHAVRAPSAGFSQGWDFLVLTDPADRALFWEVTTDPSVAPNSWLRGVSTAPCLILCWSDKGAYLRRYAEADKEHTAQSDEARWTVPYWDVDTGMAALLMLLTATDQGLGGLFFGMQREEVGPVREAFGVPEDRRIVGVVSLGYPAADRRSGSLRRGRRGVETVAHHGRWDRPWTSPLSH